MTNCQETGQVLPGSDFEVGFYTNGGDLIVYVNQMPSGLCIHRSRVHLRSELRGRPGREVSKEMFRTLGVSIRIGDGNDGSEQEGA